MNQEYNLSPFHNQADPLTNVTVTPVMVSHLEATKPWVRLMSIVLFVSVALMVLAGLVLMLMPASTMGGVGMGPMLGIFYLLLGGLYIFPAYFLHQFASSIRNFLNGGGDLAMEEALGSQKSFWRFVGILTLVFICLYAVVMVFAVLAAFVGMGS